jgi:hypothetical protein
MGNAICQSHARKQKHAGDGITAGGPVIRNGSGPIAQSGSVHEGRPETPVPDPGLHVDTATPQHDNRSQRVEHTPLGAEKDTFKFYCPLCMCYSTDILATTCCKNYTCRHCEAQILQYVKSNDPAVACPHCATVGFQLVSVSPDSLPRDYGDLSHEQPHMYNGGERQRGNSPLKIGDSFEALKRKMLTYDEEATG